MAIFRRRERPVSADRERVIQDARMVQSLRSLGALANNEPESATLIFRTLSRSESATARFLAASMISTVIIPEGNFATDPDVIALTQDEDGRVQTVAQLFQRQRVEQTTHAVDAHNDLMGVVEGELFT